MGVRGDEEEVGKGRVRKAEEKMGVRRESGNLLRDFSKC